ncbi:MAG TPA: hypothetical protein VFG81_20105 [Anaerolineales bacterium]|jgi:hypothetical protein|nr:hypothetical protein [Anaerolineales bacterium]
MDNSLTPEQLDLAIEDALRTYPVMSIPRDLSVDVLARIQTVRAQRPFRLTWMDLTLSVVLALCMGAVWFSIQNLPPLVVAQFRKESILLYQQILVNARWLIPMLAFSMAGFFAALTIPYLRRELRR